MLVTVLEVVQQVEPVMPRHKKSNTLFDGLCQVSRQILVLKEPDISAATSPAKC